MTKTLSTLAIAIAVLAAIPVGAAAPQATRLSVRYADLDLASAAGRATFNRRIASAVEAVCGSYAGAIDGEERAIARCRADAGRQVTAQLAAQKSETKLALR